MSPSRFDRLPRAVKKKKASPKREEEDPTPLQLKAEEIVNRNTEQGWTRAKIRRRSEARRRPLPTSTINSIINGHDPSIKTLERFALAYDEDPIELFRLNLDDPPDQNDFAASPIYRIFSLYQVILKKGTPEAIRRADERVEELVDFLRKVERDLGE